MSEVNAIDLQVGDRVRAGKRFSHIECGGKSAEGYVVVAKKKSVGICFDGWHDGHSLDGLLCDDDADSGWYFFNGDMVELIADPTPETEVFDKMF